MTRLFFLLTLLLLSCQKKPAVSGPDWVESAVFYQIFPERFSNGDTSNDPTLASIAGSYPHDTTSAWHISPWTADWYKLQPWEKANGKGFAYNAQRRRYGGDIQGIINRLDYLKKLGINAIYLNPVFYAPSLHKYDAAAFHHIDPFFGPDPQADLQLFKDENPADPATWQWSSADKLFLEMLDQAHRRGIRIIIDGVFNHTGINFWAFRDVREKGAASPYASWYTIKRFDDPATPEDEFDYTGWMNVRELPELKEDDKGLIPPVAEHIFAVVRRWMDPNGDGDPSDGIDGWRLDVAEMIKHPFWREFRKRVKAINPQAYITGEVFWEDWANNKLMDPEPWLRGDQFDGVMNYRWAAAMTRFFIDDSTRYNADEFAREIMRLDRSYAPQTRYQLLNLMDSHDTDRLASNIVNPDLFYDKGIGLGDNPYYDVRKPRAEEWQKLRLIAMVQMTFPGPPMIYYGTEAGMWGADDPDERKPMVWPRMQYETETANISLTPRPADPVVFDSSLFNFYAQLIRLRLSQPALTRGRMKFVYSDREKDILAYKRVWNSDEIMIVVNNSGREQTVYLPERDSEWQHLMFGRTLVYLNRDGVIVPAKTAFILKKVGEDA
ncbi:MAG TPA: alpha-amylase [Caldithrix abyssi]|uniref:Alpha-amylase n=1 Tax=Caldithrix abyssi TaxID=187145 RepID=A0A7V1LKM3_CALAY|nr:alpha-amylase [Caldithrix abyssi]